MALPSSPTSTLCDISSSVPLPPPPLDLNRSYRPKHLDLQQEDSSEIPSSTLSQDGSIKSSSSSLEPTLSTTPAPEKLPGLSHVYSIGLITSFLPPSSIALTTLAQSFMAIALRRSHLPRYLRLNIAIVVHGSTTCWRYCVCHVASYQDLLFVYDKQRQSPIGGINGGPDG